MAATEQESGAGRDPSAPEENGSGSPVVVADRPAVGDDVVSRPRSAWGRFGGGGPDGGRRLVGMLVLGALVIVCVVLAVVGVVKLTQASARAGREAASYVPPAIPTNGVAPQVVTVIGDGTSGATGPASWPTTVGSALGVKTVASVTRGAGYVTAGAGGATFVTEAAKVSPSSTVVVLFGSASDESQTTLAVITAETKAISAVRKIVPRAKVIIVGPVSTATKAPHQLLRIRDAERTAALAAKARWADPIAAKWLSGQVSALGSDGVPTATGQRLIAAAVEKLLKPLV